MGVKNIKNEGVNNTLRVKLRWPTNGCSLVIRHESLQFTLRTYLSWANLITLLPTH